MRVILDALDQHKERLIAIIESEETTPEDKYEALMRLASLTGILTDAAVEPHGILASSLCEPCPSVRKRLMTPLWPGRREGKCPLR